MNRFYAYLTAAILSGLVLFQGPAFAATASHLYYGAWMPYWSESAMVQPLTRHVTEFKEISPFSYSVNSDGSLKDNLNILQGSWLNWVTDISELNIKIIPTVTWQNGDQIYSLLSNPTSTKAHIKTLVDLADTAPFSGINIDYENKTASTEPFFSSFIKTLSSSLHAKRKTLSCSVEARTPLSSRFKVIPSDIAYANDYVAINKYCDEVDILAYDQDNVDIKLNAAKRANGNLYMPIADPDWVAKVIQEATKTISRKKIVLGVPTYGYEYRITQSGGDSTYSMVGNISYANAVLLAASMNIVPTRNNAGELGFTFDATTTYATTTTSTSSPVSIFSEKMVDVADSTSISQKIQLAKKYGLKGVILFSLNPGMDPTNWDVLK